MATEATTTRLDPSVFRLPVERIREGYYSDAYFNFTKQLLGPRERLGLGAWLGRARGAGAA